MQRTSETSLPVRFVAATAAMRRSRNLVAAGFIGCATACICALAVWAGERFGLYLFLLAVGVLACMLGLRDPVLASMYLLGATFFRLAVPANAFPVDPFLPAFAGVILSVWIRTRYRPGRLPSVEPIELLMALYIVWCAVSIIVPHQYPPEYPVDGREIPLARFVLVGTVIPFTMFLVGRQVFSTRRAARWLSLASLCAGGYSAMVSVTQFHGPGWLAWPLQVAEDPNWPGRAVGVFNQPVVNGFVLIVGFLVAMLVASAGSERWPLRGVAMGIAVASVYAIYLTHTRAVWLAFALIVVCGAVAAKGFRAGYILTAAVIALAIAVNWSAFTSEDRDAGGVASPNEVHDRLNAIATSLHAFEEKPLIGWGIGRFPAVNTYHHQQWSPEVPWERGFGIASHVDVLGIAVELGIVGVLLWVTLLTLVSARLLRAVRLASSSHGDRGYALTALLAFSALVVTGLTVDLRFFDFPNIIVMLWAGSSIGLSEELRRLDAPEGDGGRTSARRSTATKPDPAWS